MDDLIAFLRARLDEDERDALLALRGYPGGKPEVMQSWKRSARWQAGDGLITVEYVEKPPVMIQPEPERPVLVRISRRDDECTAAHIARHEPARVLVDLAAKRRIIELHTPRQRHDGDLECPTCVYTGEDEDAGGNRFRYREHEDAPCETLCLLALPYAEHPDYREEWTP